MRDIAPSPETLVVVNCAGRTRSIIGAQSLINAGVPNKVVALRNGTMGWSLAGFACDSGKNRRAPDVSPEALDWARKRRNASRRITASSASIARRSKPGAAIRSARFISSTCAIPPNTKPAMCAGAISAPGGQLVQATDQYVGTLGARIVLIDDAEVRAAMTASWLRQMGWDDVFVLAEAGTETGWPAAPMLARSRRRRSDCAAIDCAALTRLLVRNEATVVDLSLSRDYLSSTSPARGSRSGRGSTGRSRKFRCAARWC